MKKTIITFALSLILGFGAGYLVFDVMLGGSEDTPEIAQADEASTASLEETKDDSTPKEEAAAVTPVNDDNILNQKGCLGCHAVESLSLTGGATGPDLSKAFENVEGKHGKPIEEFLKEPTSAVMSGVISGNPLTDEERSQVLELLKQASEK